MLFSAEQINKCRMENGKVHTGSRLQTFKKFSCVVGLSLSANRVEERYKDMHVAFVLLMWGGGRGGMGDIQKIYG
jgi:hypothetical protein